MGIRISKDLGYGVDNLRTQKGKYMDTLSDNRIDRKKFNALHDAACDLEGKNLLDWLKKEKDDLLEFHWKHNPVREGIEKKHLDFEFKFLYQQLDQMNKAGKLDDLGGGIVYHDEFGLANVLLFIPITCPSWSRYDDIIDYCEETYVRPAGQINHVTRLKCSGIYPWNGRMVRFRDPKPGVLKEGVKPEDFKFIDATTYSQLIGWWDEKHAPMAKGEFLKHLKEDYRPAFPIDLTMLIWFMRDAFRDVDSFVNELWPMIYVHWG